MLNVVVPHWVPVSDTVVGLNVGAVAVTIDGFVTWLGVIEAVYCSPGLGQNLT
jgi:hypothetical protein